MKKRLIRNYPISCGNNPLNPPLLRGNFGRNSLFATRYWVITLILSLIIIFSISSRSYCADSNEMKHHGSWWIENYGVVSAKEDYLAVRAEDIFERVSMASDKMGNRIPSLIIIKGKGDPWAISLKDGSIVLTHGALKACYKGVTKEDGDSRLAFLLGHELAHLSNNDFWHAFAFTAVEENLKNREIKQELMAQLEKTGDIKADDPESDKFIRTKELQADSYGIISMTIAGYDPRAIVDNDTNFFEDWVSQTTSGMAYDDPRHASPKVRAEFLRSQLAAVVDAVDYFTFSVALYQLGRYSDAIVLFDAFSEHFPGREVFNNLGLCHYQLAMMFLWSSDRELPLRFKLSTTFDTETRAAKIRGKTQPDCRKDKIFVQHINNAIGYFHLALDKDPSYVPARINLSSVFIMAGRYSGAISAADEALEIEPGNPEALNNKAVALYLYGIADNVDTADNAINILKETSVRNPDFSNPVYNMAAIQSERGRKASAQETWKKFLRLETQGFYADAARKYLGIESEGMTIAPGAAGQKSPVRLEEIKGELPALLSKMESREFVIGRFTGKIYHGGGVKALAIDNVVEVVEWKLDEAMDIEKFKEKHGEPEKIMDNYCGKTLIYHDFAADVEYGKVRKIIQNIKHAGF